MIVINICYSCPFRTTNWRGKAKMRTISNSNFAHTHFLRGRRGLVGNGGDRLTVPSRIFIRPMVRTNSLSLSRPVLLQGLSPRRLTCCLATHPVPFHCDLMSQDFRVSCSEPVNCGLKLQIKCVSGRNLALTSVASWALCAEFSSRKNWKLYVKVRLYSRI